jgi:pimeloyl-ACP methyl ester carboxylesterase
MRRTMRFLVSVSGLLMMTTAALASQPFYDRTHDSKVFGEKRNYRIILPPGYETSGKAYPVIYFFHGHSDRYTLESYDGGKDFIPKMVDFVAKHDVIVVSVDGYVAKDYTGFYGGTPWDVLRDGGRYDFGAYFLELIEHIDGSFRTLKDRRHRATSGLSMGGFMSLLLSARFPDIVGSASSFNPGPEFFVGEAGRRVLWRPKDHVPSHEHSKIRLIRASGDYISQYHEETRSAYANAERVDFEYRVDEYHRHWITSIAETFEFHMRAFADPTLDNVPVSWNYSSAYAGFAVWGYRVDSRGGDGGYTYLENVRQGGLRVRTRRWAPDGPPVPERQLTIETAPLYSASQRYTLLIHSFVTGVTSKRDVNAGTDGRLRFDVDGAGCEIGIVGAGTGAQPPVLLPPTMKDRLRVLPETDVRLPIRVFNPRGAPMTGVKIRVASDYPTVKLPPDAVPVEAIAPGAAVDLSDRIVARFTAGAGGFAPTRVQVEFGFDDWHTASESIDLLVAPEVIPAPAAMEVMDGRTRTFSVFRQKGNQGGGAPVEVSVTEGKGNGNGILEPGEEATVWVKMAQGMDPFDKNNWHRCKVFSDSPWLVEVADLENPKQREWTGAQERTSLLRLSPDVPKSTAIPVILSNESWSFHYTPDVRYGVEKLYQAFQLHATHLHRYEFRVK